MDRTGSEPNASNADAHSSRTLALVVDRHPRLAPPPQRRPKQQLEVSPDVRDRASITPTMRKKYFKELILNNGLNSVLTSESSVASDPDANWALHPMEHAWMLASVDGSLDSIMQFISEDPGLLTRRDFISGFSVLHWLAKSGRHETLLEVLRFVQELGLPVNVEVQGSGGLTPLHVASMHGRYSVIKLLVGAFSASVDVMDHNGKRPWQYLSPDSPMEIKELLGTWDDAHQAAAGGDVNNIVSVTDAEQEEDAAEEEAFDRARRPGSWRFRSIRKILNSFK